MHSIGFPDVRVIAGTVGVVGLILIGALAFLPAIVGWNKRDRLGVVVLNFVAFPLLALVYVAVPTWIVALIWAFRSEKRAQLPVAQGPAITGLNLDAHPPTGQQGYTPAYAYVSPTRPNGLPVWLMTVLVAFVILGLMYLGAGFLHDSNSSNTVNSTTSKRSHPHRFPGRVSTPQKSLFEHRANSQ